MALPAHLISAIVESSMPGCSKFVSREVGACSRRAPFPLSNVRTREQLVWALESGLEMTESAQAFFVGAQPVEMVEHAFRLGHLAFTESLTDHAVVWGRSDVLEWAVANAGAPLSELALELAATFRQPEIFKWLHARGCRPHQYDDSYKYAGWNGDGALQEWMLEKGFTAGWHGAPPLDPV